MLPPGMVPPPGFSMPPPEALGGLPPSSANNTPNLASAPPSSGMPPAPSISKPPTSNTMSEGSPKKPMIGRSGSGVASAPVAEFNPVRMGLKEGTTLEWVDMNYSPVSNAAISTISL